MGHRVLTGKLDLNQEKFTTAGTCRPQSNPKQSWHSSSFRGGSQSSEVNQDAELAFPS
jgi:hypothetical protein